MKFKQEVAKKVITKDLNDNPNGFLIELGILKIPQVLAAGKSLTTSYLTAVKPGGFKGYHLHRIRTANYVCIRGKCMVELASSDGWQIVQLDSDNPVRLHIPILIPTGLKNPYDEECWIVNVPEPAYDPTLIDEQVDFTLSEVNEWIKTGYIPEK